MGYIQRIVGPKGNVVPKEGLGAKKIDVRGSRLEAVFEDGSKVEYDFSEFNDGATLRLIGKGAIGKVKVIQNPVEDAKHSNSININVYLNGSLEELVVDSEQVLSVAFRGIDFVSGAEVDRSFWDKYFAEKAEV